MERLKLQLIICIALSYIITGNICMPVHAAELELEPCESIVNNPYEFKISYTWTSEGETFQSYDRSPLIFQTRSGERRCWREIDQNSVYMESVNIVDVSFTDGRETISMLRDVRSKRDYQSNCNHKAIM